MDGVHKILLLVKTPPPFAGPELFNEAFLNSLEADNINYVIYKSNIKKRNKDKGKIDISGVFKFLSIFTSLLSIIYKEKISKVYLNMAQNRIGFLRDSFYILLFSFLGLKVIVHFHGSNFNNFYLNRNYIYKKYIERIINRVYLLIVLGEKIKQSFNKLFSVKDIKIIQNGIDLTLYKNNKNENNHIVFTIFYMAHLWFPKGIYELILAYKKLYKKYGNKVALKLAGELLYTNYSGALDYLTGDSAEYFIKNNNLIISTINEFLNKCSEYNSEYLGVLDFEKKINIFNSSTIFVLPSYTEGMSIACMEAMAMGLPVITTPVGAMEDIVSHNENGLIIPYGSYESLYDSLEFLFKNPQIVQKMSKNNKLKIAKHNDIRQISHSLEKILQAC